MTTITSADTSATPGRGAPAATGLEAGLGFRLGRAHRRLRAAWEAHIVDLGLGGPQATVLRAVSEAPDTGLRELARRVGTDPVNVKRLADGLERAGLLASTSDTADRRRRVLRPTARGQLLSHELAERAAAWNRQLATLVDPADLATLLVLLDRLETGIAGLPGHVSAARPAAVRLGDHDA